MKGTLNVMPDYCSIPLGTYFKLGAQAGFLSNFEKSPYSRADCGSNRDRLDKSMKFGTVTPAILLNNFRRVAQKSE